ncbi:hypothetical protein CGT92_12250 [Vibrio metoecus]|uniref:hypothetical protein n=1 Tax=Vibrio metoecus TaxID=1481663 RepID=UPI0006D85581|nr:hypothetical protein [Vibrio metoecus]KQB00771.1 hypothetical protein XV91_08235 [Vibrio metoecus]PAR55998.1 hypothetical protein CGT92_12250 [Vibrio metoecus]PAR60002.1 hypothetical protein CGT91_17165 [Vibrio metoecus]
MIPSLIGGGLTNSGTLPVSANGGNAGDATAVNSGAFNVGALNMGMKTRDIFMIVIVLLLVAYLIGKL